MTALAVAATTDDAAAVSVIRRSVRPCLAHDDAEDSDGDADGDEPHGQCAEVRRHVVERASARNGDGGREVHSFVPFLPLYGLRIRPVGSPSARPYDETRRMRETNSR